MILRYCAVIAVLLWSTVALGQEPPIRTGAERMEAYLPMIEGKRVAVVANQSSLVGSRHLVDTLLACDINLLTVFCPEHGFRGKAEAGEHVADELDPASKLPIVSLYGKNKKPRPEQLTGIDIVVFDLQDVGCRFYTYLSTLHYVMQACAEAGIPVVVLDRPNPNGHYVDGPVMEPGCTSFVGMHVGVPVVYGMTIGEYAMMIEGERWLGDTLHCRLTVVPLEHYRHDRRYSLPVPPSPNLRTAQAIALYPSLCLLEGTTISVGRGTPYPFEVVGNEYKLDLRNEEVQSRFNLSYILDLYAHTPHDKFFLKSNFFEKLAGTTSLRKQITRGESEETIRASWKPGLEAFSKVRSKYLLYE